MTTTTVVFPSNLGRVLVRAGLVRQHATRGGQVAYLHEPSGQCILLPDDDAVPLPTSFLHGTRGALDRAGIVSTEQFDAWMTEEQSAC